MLKTLKYFNNKLFVIFRSQIFFNFLIFLILTAALLLRLKIINTQNVTGIEADSLFRMINKFNLLELIRDGASVPPLQYLIFRFISWFSTELFWLRMPNLIFFTVIFFIVFELTRKQGKLSAIIALILLSFSPYQLEYSWESYVYLLFQFWGAVNLYSLYKLVMEKLKKNQFTFWSIIFVVSNVSGFFTHYSHIWFILAEIFYLMFLFFKNKSSKRKINKKYKKIFILLLITSSILALYLPIFNSIYHTALVNISYFNKLNILDIGYFFLDTIGIKNLILYGIDQQKTGLIGLFVFFTLMVFGLFRLTRAKSHNLFFDFGFFLALFNILLVYLISLLVGQSLLAERTLFTFSLVGIICLIQIINFGLKKKSLIINFIIVLFIFSLLRNYFLIDKLLLHNQFFSNQKIIRDLVVIAKEEQASAILFLDLAEGKSIPDRKAGSILELDYYWYGHDGLIENSPYVLIKKENYKDFYQKKDYWVVMTVNSPEFGKLAKKYCKNIGKQHVVNETGLLFECKPSTVK